MDSLLPCKRLASGSKRIRVPHYMMAQVIINIFLVAVEESEIILIVE